MKKSLITLCLVLLTAVGAQAQSETLRVWLDNHVSLTADSTTTTYVKFYQNDGDNAYVSFNLSLIVPKGIHVHQVKQGRNLVDDISLSERATTTHSIACSMPSDTILKIACTTIQNQEFYNDDEEGNPMDELFTIGLIADPTTFNGNHVVTMPADGLVFSMKQDGTYVISRIKEDVTSVFTVTGGVSVSIKNTSSDDSPKAIYDLSGRKLNEPLNKGVYIENGKKVMK